MASILKPPSGLTPAEVLPRAGLFRLLGALTVIVAPHVVHVPAWASLLVVFVILWRAAAALRGWRPMLPSVVRIGLALAAFAGVYASFGRVTGQTAGVALIVVMAALKLTEIKARRDLMVMAFLMYFLLITHFLFSQELWTAAYLVACAILVTGVLMDANHPGSALPTRLLLRRGARMVGQALPLMVVIFILFPRVPGPLWGLPADAGAARSGLSDSMSPGDISRLIQSDETAFRVRFDGPPPPMRERYWRGPVLSRFDGRRWDIRARPPATPEARFLPGPVRRYELTLEPNRTPWLMALDLPVADGIPADAQINADYQLVLSKGDLRERRLLRLVSQTRYLLEPALSADQRKPFLQLPRGFDPRTIALGRQWRSETGDDDQRLVDRALTMFREQKFFYTLQPPALGRDGIDEFLFDTRRGFCEHYAGSFTFLMRAAGVPARVVTGYQGGDKATYGDDYVVSYKDAHAWSEVWLEGRGWVRVDPTAAVAPDRVERGLAEALSSSAGLPDYLDPANRQGFRFNLSARWDWLNAQWNHWVLGYGPDLQQEFMRHLGLVDWGDMILALTVTLSVGVGVIGFLLLRRAEPQVRIDASLRIWRRLQRRLARLGLSPSPTEGPLDYAERVAVARPALAEPIRGLAARYVALRYAGDGSETEFRRLAESVRLPRR